MSEKKPDKGTPPGDGTTPPEAPPSGQVAGQGKDEPLSPQLQATLTRMRQEDAQKLQAQRSEMEAQMREELDRRLDKPDEPDLPDGVDLGALDKVVTQIPGFKALVDQLGTLQKQVHNNALSSGMAALKGKPFLDEVRNDMADSLQGVAGINPETVEAVYRHHAYDKLAARLAELETQAKQSEVTHRNALAAAGVDDTGGTASGGPQFDPGSATDEELETLVGGLSGKEKMASMGLVAPEN